MSQLTMLALWRVSQLAFGTSFGCFINVWMLLLIRCAGLATLSRSGGAKLASIGVGGHSNSSSWFRLSLSRPCCHVYRKREYLAYMGAERRSTNILPPDRDGCFRAATRKRRAKSFTGCARTSSSPQTLSMSCTPSPATLKPTNTAQGLLWASLSRCSGRSRCLRECGVHSCCSSWRKCAARRR